MPVERINPETMHHNPAFTQMVVLPADARLALIGGQNAVAADGTIVGRGDLARQTAEALKNLVTCLEAAGATVDDLVQMKIWLVAGQDIRPGFEAWMKVWGDRGNPPVVTAAFVSALAHPDFLVEIEATAVLPG